LITLLAKKDKKVFWQLSKSFSTNLTATWILKYAINKPRPRKVELTDMLFFRAHTFFSFQGASFLQKRYGGNMVCRLILGCWFCWL